MKPLPRTSIADVDHTVERLSQVVRVLEELPREKQLDLTFWFIRGKCKSTACAIGEAASDPWFNKQGLKLTRDRVQRYRGMGVTLSPSFAGVRGDDAVDKFFKLEWEETGFLFFPGAYHRGSKHDVIRRIRSFCKKLEKQKAGLS
ncbi:MAG: hypothetical protein ACR2PS_18515 [Pseudomonadales bacterium]